MLPTSNCKVKLLVGNMQKKQKKSLLFTWNLTFGLSYKGKESKILHTELGNFINNRQNFLT